jgi:hypothetical protein
MSNCCPEIAFRHVSVPSKEYSVPTPLNIPAGTAASRSVKQARRGAIVWLTSCSDRQGMNLAFAMCVFLVCMGSETPTPEACSIIRGSRHHPYPARPWHRGGAPRKVLIAGRCGQPAAEAAPRHQAALEAGESTRCFCCFTANLATNSYSLPFQASSSVLPPMASGHREYNN